uniref:Uncharacterized protein n=1 Tax=Anguilla anguilla TaxID=7936 RepID=A0A0E9PA45_ANGAN
MNTSVSAQHPIYCSGLLCRLKFYTTLGQTVLSLRINTTCSFGHNQKQTP